MKFNKELMQRIAYNDLLPDEAEVIEDIVVDNSRWSINHSVIFKIDGKFYESYYSVGATEYQDESPYEHEGDEIECDEVFPVERTITVYVKDKGKG